MVANLKNKVSTSNTHSLYVNRKKQLQRSVVICFTDLMLKYHAAFNRIYKRGNFKLFNTLEVDVNNSSLYGEV